MCIILLAVCFVLAVICSCEWSRTKDGPSARESNYRVGREHDAVGEKKKILKVRYLIKDSN